MPNDAKRKQEKLKVNRLFIIIIIIMWYYAMKLKITLVREYVIIFFSSTSFSPLFTFLWVNAQIKK